MCPLAGPEPLDQRFRDWAPVRKGGELRPPEPRRRPGRVDGATGACRLDASHGLARPRDAEGDVELRGDRPSALADLTLPGDPAEVDRHTAPTYRRAEKVRQHLELAETFGSHAPAAGD